MSNHGVIGFASTEAKSHSDFPIIPFYYPFYAPLRKDERESSVIKRLVLNVCGIQIMDTKNALYFLSATVYSLKKISTF